MKTMVILVCGFLLLAMSAPAAARHEIGVIAGLNMAHLHAHELEARGSEFSPSLRFGVGAVIDLSLTDRFGFRFEPMYLQKGAEGNADLGDQSKIKLDYLQVPVLFKYAFGRAVRPYLALGPSLGIRLNANLANLGPEQTKAIDFGIDLGVGMSVPIGKGNFFLEAFYAQGLVNIDDSQTAAGEENKTMTHDSRIMAGFSFPLGQKD